jgi:Holliday junction resolvase RusA-like endonuclease
VATQQPPPGRAGNPVPGPSPSAGAASRLGPPAGARLPLLPLAKPRMTRRDQWQKRPVVVTYRAWCDAIRLLGGRAGIWTLLDHVDVTYGLPMPPSWSAKRRAEMNGQPHRQKPDIDNLTKALFDALCEDDSHIASLVARKIWTTEPFIHLHTSPIPHD